jgi:sulfate adenylyltransferase large subunit
MEKETIKIVIVGHVDHGKSTMIGRLLFETNSLPKGKIEEIKRVSKELGKEAELAYLVDQLKEERERNVTIDTTQIFFRTRKKNYVIIDAPGHVEFIKNMITGASLAEAAVLIVDTQEGVREQTRRHAYLLSLLGLSKVIVVFNKMDLIDFNMERFEEVKTELLQVLENLKIKPSFLIPISAKEGMNIAKKHPAKLNWYKGPTLIDALDSIKLDISATKRPLRFPIQGVYEIDGERILMGRMASGIIKQGHKVILLPSGREAEIKAIRVFGEQRTIAEKGECIGVVLKESLPVKRGEVIAQKSPPPQPLNRFKGNIFWMSSEPLQINQAITLRCATQETKCVAERIEKRINSSTLEIIEENAKELKLNEAGMVEFKTEKPILAEEFSFVDELGRFVLEKEYNARGAGIITEKTAD